MYSDVDSKCPGRIVSLTVALVNCKPRQNKNRREILLLILVSGSTDCSICTSMVRVLFGFIEFDEAAISHELFYEKC
jgi:thioredoxin-related protein